MWVGNSVSCLRLGEGFGDAWRNTEDTVHRLTGQQGAESFRAAWKDLGTSLFETAKDHYGTATRVVIDEAEAARRNPKFWMDLCRSSG